MNEELKGKLKGLGLKDDQIAKLETDGGATTEADIALLSAEEIKNTAGCNIVVAKKIAKAFTAPAPTAAAPQMVSMDVLPAIPDEKSFLEPLKVGGVLKIQAIDVMAAIRAGIADKARLFTLPDMLLEKMDQFAQDQSEPVGVAFWHLRNQVTRRGYGDLFAAMEETPGTFINDRRKKELLQRLNSLLWPALGGFHDRLTAWSDVWAKGAANPAMAFAFLAMGQVGVPGAVLPPGIMQPPDTAPLRDEAEAVIDRINKVFAGTGIVVARALAYDATRVREVLEDPTLPATIGSATREQMLKTLGIDVGAADIRLEKGLAKYALSIMELPKVAQGPVEYTYLAAMLQLGASIAWDKLGVGSITKEEERPAGRGDGFRDREGRNTF